MLNILFVNMKKSCSNQELFQAWEPIPSYVSSEQFVQMQNYRKSIHYSI